MRLDLLREHLSVAPDGGLARAVCAGGRAGQVGGAAAGDHDPAAAALDHPGQREPAGEVDATDVHLEEVPPLVGVGLPGVLPERNARIRNEQVDRPGRLEHPFDVLPLGDVAGDRGAADLRGDLLDLLARATGHRHVPAGACELAGDARADPAASSCDECITRHSGPPSSRGVRRQCPPERSRGGSGAGTVLPAPGCRRR